jgi:hypothetical protein
MNLMPIGQADCKGPDHNGLAVWRLSVRWQAQERRALTDLDFAEKLKATTRSRGMLRVSQHKG